MKQTKKPNKSKNEDNKINMNIKQNRMPRNKNNDKQTQRRTNKHNKRTHIESVKQQTAEGKQQDQKHR